MATEEEEPLDSAVAVTAPTQATKDTKIKELTVAVKTPSKPSDGERTTGGAAKTYRAATKTLFWKRDADPASTRIVKKPAKLGDYLYTTGDIWTGPSGGQWVELDSRDGNTGWVLVQGPGFGLAGPALLDAEDALTVDVFFLGGGYEKDVEQGFVWEGLMGGKSTVRQLKEELCRATPLNRKQCVLGRDLPSKIADGSKINAGDGHSKWMGRTGEQLPVDYMPEVADDVRLIDCKLEKKDRQRRNERDLTMLLVYVGDVPEGLKFLPQRPLPKIPTADEAHELRKAQRQRSPSPSVKASSSALPPEGEQPRLSN